MSWACLYLQSPKHKGTKQPEVVAVTRVQRVVDKNGHLDFQPNLAEETQETPAEQLASLSYIASAGEHWPHSVAVYHRTLAGGSCDICRCAVRHSCRTLGFLNIRL